MGKGSTGAPRVAERHAHREHPQRPVGSTHKELYPRTATVC
jgi:hypothetical protein